MKKLLITCAAIAAQVFVPFFAANGQKLSTNAEILLATKPEQGISKLKSVAGVNGGAEADNAVSAFIMTNNVSALRQSLGELGIKANSEFATFVTAVIPVDLLRRVSELPEVDYVSMSNPVSLRMDVARKAAGVDNIHNNTNDVFDAPFTGKGVVVGLIDSGLEYNHIAFREPGTDTPRISRVWNQLATRGSAPEGYDYGVELKTPEQIKGASYDTSSEFHGSHTTGIAAGGDKRSKYYGVATEAEIVYVSFDDEDAHIADAINYIFSYADEVGKPCVINMSLGSHFGPHDGSSMLDQVIDEMSGPGRIIVGAAGNEGEHRLHLSKTFTEDDTEMKTMLTFHPDLSHKIHYVEVWGTPGTDFEVKACVVESLKGRVVTESRTSSTSNPDMATAITVFELSENGVEASVVIQSERNPISDAPHASIQIQCGDMNTGRMVGLIVDGEAGQTINAWNASLHEFSSNNKPGWTNGTNEGTVGEIGGTAHRIISVGSYDSRSTFPALGGGVYQLTGQIPFELNHTSSFSSLGPTADGRIVPTILAAGSPVIAAYNYYAFGTTEAIQYQASEMVLDNSGRKYYYGYNMGTSMAAPFVAGSVALMLEANPELTPEEVTQILQATANTNLYMGSLPNNSYGAGRINTLEAMKMVLNNASIGGVTTSPESLCKVWVEKGTSTVNIAVPTAQVGASAGVWNTTGAKVAEISLGTGVTSVDASAWGHGIFVVTLPDSTAKIIL